MENNFLSALFVSTQSLFFSVFQRGEEKTKVFVSVISSKTLFNLFHLTFSLKINWKVFCSLSSSRFRQDENKDWNFPNNFSFEQIANGIIISPSSSPQLRRAKEIKRRGKNVFLDDKTQIQIILFLMPSLEYQLHNPNFPRRRFFYLREMCLMRSSKWGMLGRSRRGTDGMFSVSSNNVMITLIIS